MPHPRSCDTFVVLPQITNNKSLVFGKNSDRPQNEVQEVVFIKGGIRPRDLKCTYITIEESTTPVNDVILSKPSWMWGAEMGANDKNVVIGNEAVWTKHNNDDGDSSKKRLLGMDLLRLGLERGNTAEAALHVVTSLLEKYGQGGPCSEHDASLTYHNSYIIADSIEAWVLETSGKLWVAEKVEGYRNISNGLTITTKIDKCSNELQLKAKELGLWDGQAPFNFKKCFSSGTDVIRQTEGEKLLREASKGSSFNFENMFDVLRHKESGICRPCDDSFPTQGSQVSMLSTSGLNVHWFTATPDPSLSLFKPFIFVPGAVVSAHTKSPDEAKREHVLYKAHADQVRGGNREVLETILQQAEKELLDTVKQIVEKYNQATVLNDDEQVNLLQKKAVEFELRLYGHNIKD